MNTGLKLVIGGVAAYLIYEWYLASQNVAAPVAGANQSGGSGATATTTQSTNQQANNAPAEQPRTVSAAQLIAAAGGNAPRTADSWNYFYGQVSGVHQSANLFTPTNRGELISVTTYLARRTAAGLSGLGQIYGVPVYAFADGRGPRGAQMIPQDIRGFTRATGWERARKVNLN